jgi:hypothetical protein
VELLNYGTASIPLGGYSLQSGSNTYVLPPQNLAPGAYFVLTGAELGFVPPVTSKLFLFAPGKSSLVQTLVIGSVSQARVPEGTGDWRFPSQPTPGTTNQFAFRNDVVINEIMYQHRQIPASAGVYGPTNEFINFTNTWRYHDTDVDPGTSWREPGYNDSGWLSGLALLYNSPSTFPLPKNTLLAPTNSAGQRIITYYFRTPFVVTGSTAGLILSFRAIVDDGAVYYINGVEVYRQNMPAGTISYGTVASASIGVATFTGPFPIPSTALVAGTNWLAVEVHRISTVDNDVVFGMELVGSAQLSPPLPARDSPESWIELFNRSSNAVNLTGWRLDHLVDYRFAAGATIPAGGYLVVAKDVSYMQALYPNIAIAGPFTNKLSGTGGSIALKDANNNPVNEVRYYDGGAWPEAANGGGSSLELRDPWADNSKPEAWAASDEGSKAPWVWYTNRAVAVASPQPATVYNELILGLLDAGECLIDDLRLVESPTNAPISLLQNGTFSSGLAAWRILGDQKGSIVPDPSDPANPVLRLLADGPTEYLHNHAETTLKNGASYYSIVNGKQYELSFRAKWISGNNLLNSRLWMNRVPRTFELAVPALNGTPGARNSRYETNVGPTFANLHHARTVPLANEAVSITVEVSDPQGVSVCNLFWSVNGGAWQNGAMSPQGVAGAYQQFTGSIPGAAAGAVVQFYVQAMDGQGAISVYPASGTNSRALYQVDDGRALLSLANNMRIIMTPVDADYLLRSTNLMSNGKIGATFIWQEEEVYYDAGIRVKGSEHGRADANRLGFFLDFRADQLFRGIHSSLGVDRSGGWRFGTTFGQDEIVIKHIINHVGGLPGMYDDLIRVITPNNQFTGPAILQMARYGGPFLDGQFQNGSDGTTFEYEYIYDSSATTGGPEGIKLPQEGSVVGVTLSNLGDDKENYRLDFIIKNRRQNDDYSELIPALKAVGQSAGSSFDAATDQALDVDEWLRAYALSALVGPGDNYGGDNAGHNLMLYTRPEDQKTMYFIWDTDFAFYTSATGSITPNIDLQKFIVNTDRKRRYYQNLFDIINTTYNAAYMGYWTDHYDNFLPGQNFSSILTYIDQRANYVLSQLPTNAVFAITSNGGADFATTNNTLTLTGTAPLGVRTIEVNGISYPITWTSVTNWTLSIPLYAGANTLQVQGVTSQGLRSSNALDTISVTNTGTGSLHPVVINEWMADNAGPGGFPDPLDGLYQDWFELYNPNVTAVNLGGFYLTDTLSQPTKWAIPGNTIIPPLGFLRVWADNEPSQNGLNGDLHAGFQLSASGESIGLFNHAGVLQHGVTFSAQTQNRSQGFYPDGNTNALYTMPNWSPGAPNRLDALPIPQIYDLRSVQGSALAFSFTTLPGRTYQVHAATNLDGQTWTLATPPTRAGGSFLSSTNPIGNAPHYFYRVRLLE